MLQLRVHGPTDALTEIGEAVEEHGAVARYLVFIAAGALVSSRPGEW